MKIWKYPIAIQPELQTIQLPRLATILAFRLQKGKPYIWVFANPGSNPEPRIFQIFGTGQDLPSWCGPFCYHGTVQMGSGVHVWHLFER